MHEIGIEWMTQTEVNGHFLELRGIPDEKLEWERIPEAIAGANYYNIQNIPGQLTVEPDSGKIYLKIQILSEYPWNITRNVGKSFRHKSGYYQKV